MNNQNQTMINPKQSLDNLIKPFDFPTYPEDNIKTVKIVMMRLKPYNGECSITLKIPDTSTKTIHELATRWISSEGSAVINILIMREVEILIEFIDGKNINFRVKSDGDYFIDNKPDQCHSGYSKLIEKYLNYWHLTH